MLLDSLRLLQPLPAQPHLPLFVFFPGMDGTGKLLHKQVDRLSTKFDVRCVAIASNDRSDWNGLTNRTLELIEHELSKGRELYLCGESFGACLAMQVASKISDKIDQLILINPASSLMRLPWLAGGSALSSLLPDLLYPLSAKFLVNFLIAADRVASAERQSLIDAMLSVHPQTAAWRVELLRRFQVHSLLPTLMDIPVLLIAGKLDQLLPSTWEVQILQQRLPKAKTMVLPCSGHACLLEKDLYLADLL